MKIRLLIVCLILCLHAHAQVFHDPEIAQMEGRSHSKLLDSRSAALRTNASTNFNVSYYRCEWEVDPAVNYIKGKVTTHFVMNATGTTIELDLVDALTVSSVSKSGVPVAFTQANNTLSIDFPSPVAATTKDSVTIHYEGAPPVAGGAFVASIHGPSNTPVIWTLSEPYGSRDWWPCKNGLDDKADSVDIYITHPSAYKAASNGLLQGETLIAGNKIRTHWKHRYAIASYLVCFAVTNYSVFDNSVVIGGTNVPVKTFCYPESQGAFQAGTQNTLDAMVLFSNLFGDYPFKNEKYGHVQFGWGGGMEHQTCSFMVHLGEGLVAHELAHQWFGNKITCGSWQDIWLNEGFATHLASIYTENKYPVNAKVNRLAEINNITSQPAGSVWVDNVNDVSRIFSNRLSYLKGSHLLYMLRWILGDATFFTAIQNYINDPALAYGFATTANLKSHLENASGKNLTYFFDQWFTGQGYPSYQVEWYPTGNNVEIKLSQTQSHASVPFFRLPVPLLFRNPGTGQEKLVVLDHTFSGQVFADNLGFEATEVVFDPEAWLITRNNTLTKTSGPLPVVFGSFEVACAGPFAQLTWETTEETNADYFEIQKSHNALQWETVGNVEAVGNSKVRQTYTFDDTTAAEKGIYYRIVEHDFDGRTQYTSIRKSTCGPGSEGVFIYPNPVNLTLQIHTQDWKEAIQSINITSASGISYQLKAEQAEGFNQYKKIDVSNLPAGLYILGIQMQKSMKYLKFLKE